MVAIGITILVYGAVALIVKADDMGLHLAVEGRTEAGRAMGRGIVEGMPAFLRALTFVGTLAMLWVGGSIITHALAGMGLPGPEEVVHTIAHSFEPVGGFVEWLAGAGLHGVLGLAIGMALIPVVMRVVNPALRAVGIGLADSGH